MMDGLYTPKMGSRFGRGGTPVDMACCRAMTYSQTSHNFNQCDRKASVEQGGIGFCKQHAPSAVAARSAASDAKSAARYAAHRAPFDRLAAFRLALETIAAGHNDARQYAADVLAKHAPKVTGQ